MSEDNINKKEDSDSPGIQWWYLKMFLYIGVFVTIVVVLANMMGLEIPFVYIIYFFGFLVFLSLLINLLVWLEKFFFKNQK